MDFYEFTREIGFHFGNWAESISGYVSAANLVLVLLGYVLGSIGLYAIAKRRCISNPWMAWVPLVKVWILGSISDQYRYVTKGQVKSKRKIMLVLEIILYALGIALIVMSISAIVQIIQVSYFGTEQEIVAAVVGHLLGLLGLIIANVLLGAVRAVFHYLALYDLYTSANPANNVLFLVLSIFLSFLEPFLVFAIRNKDGGMPPRCAVPVEPLPSSSEPWEQ